MIGNAILNRFQRSRINLQKVQYCRSVVMSIGDFHSIPIPKLDVLDDPKLNLNADLRGPTRAKMDDELQMALEGPARALQFSAPVLVIHFAHGSYSPRSAFLGGRQRSSPRLFNAQLRNFGIEVQCRQIQQSYRAKRSSQSRNIRMFQSWVDRSRMPD